MINVKEEECINKERKRKRERYRKKSMENKRFSYV